MKTHFAPPERASKNVVAEQFQLIANNPVIDNLMKIMNGLFAVLNKDRQILALNESFLKFIGVENVEDVLGLRPGEYVKCIHACDMEGGCGTSEYCSTCGAVVSMMATLDTDVPVENHCVLTVERDNKETELFLQVRCAPIKVRGEKYLLLFLHDISVQQQRANLERTFFHDFANIITGIMGCSELLMNAGKCNEDRLHDFQRQVNRLAQEFSIQKELANSISHSYQPLYKEVQVRQIMAELQELFENHTLINGRKIEFKPAGCDISLVTDQNLVSRILVNMITNALEASGDGDTVKVYLTPEGNAVTFCVWNRKVIPADVSKRIFQRNFTTKQKLGHGLGTFSMKYFGERVLGGAVSFSSVEGEGTTFRFTLEQKDGLSNQPTSQYAAGMEH